MKRPEEFIKQWYGDLSLVPAAFRTNLTEMIIRVQADAVGLQDGAERFTTAEEWFEEWLGDNGISDPVKKRSIDRIEAVQRNAINATRSQKEVDADGVIGSMQVTITAQDDEIRRLKGLLGARKQQLRLANKGAENLSLRLSASRQANADLRHQIQSLTATKA